ncbi:Phosphoenolpyruvate carboxykinase [Giardia muris]|uniref:phosphoenolpyruvate carboxykinase (GTP) n=1 Tax=Giardia muris TaxID=5742 RepID=A0A4Z1T7I3_GIAMU|nr:Phosphoenolpyruvate carboxykinase [Giardia muris]|eukprot:TNJ28461.1 Phosphoenolpyruvate carboxykinase [Giardia muris]
MQDVIDERSKAILDQISCPVVVGAIRSAVKLLEPSSMYIQTCSDQELSYARDNALIQGEETKLGITGFSCRFEGPVVPVFEVREASKDIDSKFRGRLSGRQLIVSFYLLGPYGNPYSMFAVQFTDSWSVLHAQNLLYRNGFRLLVDGTDQTSSASKLSTFYCLSSMDPIIAVDSERRVAYCGRYTDPRVHKALFLSLHAAYVAMKNEVGAQLESLTISRLQSHHDRGSHVTIGALVQQDCYRGYFAFSPGSTFYGYDIACIYPGVDAKGVQRCLAIADASGAQGVMDGINRVGIPTLFSLLSSQRECLLFNVLIGSDGKPYWPGMYAQKSMDDMVSEKDLLPPTGTNAGGPWVKPSKDITPGGALFTLGADSIPTAVQAQEEQKGIALDALVCFMSDFKVLMPPIYQAHNWAHGVYITALSEAIVEGSEVISLPTTVLTPTRTRFGTRLKLGERLGDAAPKVFAMSLSYNTNKGLAPVDINVWNAWVCGRVSGLYKARCTPIGWIPYYENIAELFQTVLGKKYLEEEYIAQFTLHTDHYLNSMEAVMKAYGGGEAHTDWVIAECRVMRALRKLQAERGVAIPPSSFPSDPTSEPWYDPYFGAAL